MKKIIVCTFSILFLAAIFTFYALASCKKDNGGILHYKEIPYPTPNIEPDTLNDVQGVVLHHTVMGPPHPVPPLCQFMWMYL